MNRMKNFYIAIWILFSVSFLSIPVLLMLTQKIDVLLLLIIPLILIGIFEIFFDVRCFNS